MKQYVVLVSMIMLGIYIFNIIAGNGEGTINSSLQHIWQQGVLIRTYNP